VTIDVELDGLFVDLVVPMGVATMSLRVPANWYWGLVDQGIAIRAEEARQAEIQEIQE
jgi:hypothetical protein